jgi:hypothetical protein
MFYLVNSTGDYIVGYVEEGEAVVHRASRDSHIQKEVIRMESDEAAFDRLCALVHEAKIAGYQEEEASLSPIDIPYCYQASIPTAFRGVYASVKSCTADQFEAGLARLEAACKAIGAVFPLTLKRSEGAFSLHEGKAQTSVSIKLLSQAEWETYPARTRELSDNRGYLDQCTILPSGRGLLGFSTGRYLTEITLRAFFAGAIKAGAQITLDGDHGWKLNPAKPFHKADIEDSSWFRIHPEAYQMLSDAGFMAIASAPRKRMRFI